MNQGKVDFVKREMARVNINTLGISELKWMGMGEFNSDDHYIYYYGKESLRRNGVPLIVNKRVQNAVASFFINLRIFWMQSQKGQNDLFISKANHSISQ